MLTRIDAHQHCWRLARGDYRWLRTDDPLLAPLARDFSLADAAPLMAPHGVATVVLVQAADTTAETDFLLNEAAAHEIVGGVVGWADLADATSVPRMERWSTHVKFRGVRPMLQDLPQDDWIQHAPRAIVMQALIRLGLRFDALVKPRHLSALAAFAHAWPELPIVIDHAAKPALAEGWDGAWAVEWRRQMRALAAMPQVCCKVSGLFTELSAPQRATVDTMTTAVTPVIEQLLEWFGPDRLMWGSDWPVLSLAAGYADWVHAVDGLIDTLSPDEQAEVRHRAASRFYRLEQLAP